MSLSDIAKEREKKLAELQRAGKEAALEREAKKRGIPYTNIVEKPALLDHETMQIVSKEDARRGRLVPLQKKNTNIRLGVVDPGNIETQEIVKDLERRGFSVTNTLISLPSLERALKEYTHITPQQKREPRGTLTIPSEADIPSALPALRSHLETGEEIETSRLLVLLAGTGLKLNASDLHIEPADDGARLRLRLDGVLEDVGVIAKQAYDRLVSRIKVLSSVPLNIVTRAHDGRFSIEGVGAEPIEIRTSILPSPEGEYVVLRLLNPNAVALKIDELGLEDDLWNTLKPHLESPNGIILTTGPTGSGKTTTLYAFLKYLNKPEIKVITLENPIEYHLKGVSQTQIDTKDEYGFAKGVRAALRHDPDIMLIGEIRDNETADAALNASLTGHLVFSTLHTNDAAGAIPRFLDLNAKPSILSSALRAIIAQRLVRRLCELCRRELVGKEKESAQVEIRNALAGYPSLREKDIKSTPLYKSGEGCEKCSRSGYKGRIGIFEILAVDDNLERLITDSPSHREVLNYALGTGFQTMYVNGLCKVLRGITSLEEVHRVAAKISVESNK